MSSKKCKNYDGSEKVGYYKGNEPSPKGLGYCAKYEVEGTQTFGKDGNLWQIINGKWVKVSKTIKSSNKSAKKSINKSKKTTSKSKKLNCKLKINKSKKEWKSKKSESKSNKTTRKSKK